MVLMTRPVLSTGSLKSHCSTWITKSSEIDWPTANSPLKEALGNGHRPRREAGRTSTRNRPVPARHGRLSSVLQRLKEAATVPVAASSSSAIEQRADEEDRIGGSLSHPPRQVGIPLRAEGEIHA